MSKITVTTSDGKQSAKTPKQQALDLIIKGCEERGRDSLEDLTLEDLLAVISMKRFSNREYIDIELEKDALIIKIACGCHGDLKSVKYYFNKNDDLMDFDQNLDNKDFANFIIRVLS